MDKLNPVREPKDRPRSSCGPHICLLTSNIFTGKQLEDGLGSSECAYVPFMTNSVSCSSASSLKMDREVQGIHTYMPPPDQQRLIFSSKQLEDGPGCPEHSYMLPPDQQCLIFARKQVGDGPGSSVRPYMSHLTSNVLSFLTSMDQGVRGIHIHPLDS